MENRVLNPTDYKVHPEQRNSRREDTIVVENNHYFPLNTVKADYLPESQTHTTCSWKGLASYYPLTVNGKTNTNTAWFYPDPKPAASQIKDHVAFWKGVTIVA